MGATVSNVLDTQLKASFRRPRPLFIVIGIVIAIYLLTPILIVFPAAFTAGTRIQVPPEGLSLQWFEAFFTNVTWIRALGTSVQVGLIGATIATVTATLAVLGLSRSPRLATWLRPIFFVPMIFPIVVLALGLLRGSLALGVSGSLFPLVLGQALICLPPAFIAVSTGLVRVDPALSNASNSMGASWWRTAFTVELPLMKGAVVTAFMLSFVYGFDEVVLAIFLAPSATPTLPAKLYAAASQSLDPILASASVVIVGSVIVGTLLYLLSARLIARSRQL
jgi:putative spermidine/putrescine transport system permease protein